VLDGAISSINAATFETRLLQTIEERVGPEVAQLTGEILAARFAFQPSGTATLIGVGLLLFGASGVLLQLRGVLNAMWHIEARPASVPATIWGVAKGYLISVAAALLLGLVPILLLFASAVVASLPAQSVEAVYRSESLTTVIQILASPVAYFILFAFVLKYLP